jgi:hypothetical protein
MVKIPKTVIILALPKLTEKNRLQIDELRRLAGAATLHPGVVSDPTNTIKSDLFHFCEGWSELEAAFASAVDRIRREKRIRKPDVVPESRKKVVQVPIRCIPISSKKYHKKL